MLDAQAIRLMPRVMRASWPGPASQATAAAAAPGAAPLLEVSELRCSFGGVQAVAGASFAVRTGTLTGLIGPNGAGKSTVINIIGGQVRPTAGTVRFDGHPIGGMAPHDISRAGITRTFQTANVFGRLTVLENLLLGAPHWRGETLRAALTGKWLWRRNEAALIDKAQAILARKPKGRIATPRLMGAVYSEILKATETQGFVPPRKRVSLSRGKLAALLLRAGFG